MHKMNVVGIVFRGSEGKKAIQQIMRAKPVRNKYTVNAESRMREFEESEAVRNFLNSIKPDVIPHN
ncbi:MAG: hypothetical protein IJJ70_00405 [Treponema sp.]|nr:hypothetical protein [Treponema sp.]MBR0486151.1 hypothetical protein [Treponema sp.]